jgi:hypothetical protein
LEPQGGRTRPPGLLRARRPHDPDLKLNLDPAEVFQVLACAVQAQDGRAHHGYDIHRWINHSTGDNAAIHRRMSDVARKNQNASIHN